MGKALLLITPLLIGYILDLLLGDPDRWPHPVRIFGNLIAKGDALLNKNRHRFIKGMLLATALVASTFLFFAFINAQLLSVYIWLYVLVNGIFVWYGLANKSLITESQNVFTALEKRSLQAGRTQLSRIVGRDTAHLSGQQIRIAVLETMSENLSDGVVAPIFYYAIAGVPGMMAYKMINTMDSMLGYRNDRYEWFGKFPARLDDAANFIPSRLTALLMVLVTGSGRGLSYVLRFGNRHKSPNAGYPEAAMAGILNCRFGGSNVYHGIVVDKPVIGENDRIIMPHEIQVCSRINHKVCLLMVILCIAIMSAAAVT